METNQMQSGLTPEAAVRTLQIIVFALATGVLFFFGFTLFNNKLAFDGQPNTLCQIGLVFAAVAFMLHFIIPGFIQRAGISQISKQSIEIADEDKQFMMLFPHRQTATIIAGALLEGAAFMNTFAYMQTRYLWSAAVVVTLVFFIILRMPTVNSAKQWAQDRVREIEMRFDNR